MIFNVVGGGSPDAITKDKIVNNFTTTEEGFVADARALKVLNESKLDIARAFFGNNALYSQTAVNSFETLLDTAPYGETVQTAYNAAEVVHGDHHMGNQQYVIFTINYARTYGWILVIGFGGMYFGSRRNSRTITWTKIA